MRILLRCVNCGVVLETETERACARFDMHMDAQGDRRPDGALCSACYRAGGICYACELEAPEVGPAERIQPEEPSDVETWGKPEYRPERETEDGGEGTYDA